MATFLRLLIGVALVLTCISLDHVNSLPTNNTVGASFPDIASIIVNNYHTCTPEDTCNGHGDCRLNETGCDCKRGWTTYNTTAEPTKYCNYKQRSKKTAFFISFFTGPLGTDWFYLSRANLGYIVVGILKLLLGFGCCSAWPLTFFGPEMQNSDDVKAKLRGVSICFSLIAFSWWIVDWARILGNRFPDGNAAALIPW